MPRVQRLRGPAHLGKIILCARVNCPIMDRFHSSNFTLAYQFTPYITTEDKHTAENPLPLCGYGSSLVDVSGQVPVRCAHLIKNKK